MLASFMEGGMQGVSITVPFCTPPRPSTSWKVVPFSEVVTWTWLNWIGSDMPMFELIGSKIEFEVYISCCKL